MSSSDLRKLRIAIVGGCQVVGLAEAARRFLPDADVQKWHVGVIAKNTPQLIADQLSQFDLVISQFNDAEKDSPLALSQLRNRQLPVIYLPALAFNGFHPDCTYLRDGRVYVKGPGTDYHSVIVAAAHTLGVPRKRVAELFNAYVFAELGYLNAFDAAKNAVIANFRMANFDLTAAFEIWLRQVGQFMYTINHPHILVMATLCQQVLAQAGYVDANDPVPEGIKDYAAEYFTWPTYPAIAKQIGIAGSTTFKRNSNQSPKGQCRELPLAEYISSCYDIYDGLEKGVLDTGNVATACQRLRPLISL